MGGGSAAEFGTENGGHGKSSTVTGTPAAMMATLTDEELAARIFGDLEGVGTGMGSSTQQLLTPPTEVLSTESGSSGLFGGFGDDAPEAELFGWSLGELPTSGFGL
ncbi:hypothetical protein BFW01_g2306 [Lasiodiplodia theobromae]|nr:hypothetical protein BFW01_g2306 [Lasiodiplodia theobromae]